MGIYLPNMEMPNKKNGAVLIIYPDGRCVFENGEEYKAVPVPPHGRLIDADALVWDNGIKEIPEYYEVVCNAPTIIPASEEAGEC